MADLQTMMSMLGKRIVVTNPQFPDVSWKGELIAYVPEPSVIIEFEDGERMTLPARWAALDPNG